MDSYVLYSCYSELRTSVTDAVYGEQFEEFGTKVAVSNINGALHLSII